MRSRLLLIVASCLVAVTAPQVQAQERSRAEVYALEGLGTLPGIAGCGCLGLGLLLAAAAISFGNDNPGSNPGWTAVVASMALVSGAALPAAAGYGTARVGLAIGEDGSPGWAIGGAYAGLPLAIGGIALGEFVGDSPGNGDQSPWRYPIYALAGLAIPTGAVLGYNLGAPSRSDFGSRLQLPGVGLTMAELPDRSVEYGLKVQLAGLRF